MKIVADQAVPLLSETFGTFGEVQRLHSKAITADIVKDTDVVVVRTRTKVNRDLLEGSRVKFVAAACVGTDHVDLDYLRQAGIGFSNAPGSNANAVAEYVMTALFTLASERGFILAGKTIGVIGVGNVGSRVVRKAELLGMRVLQNDPPRERAEGRGQFVSLSDAVGADIVTFHVPLNLSGEDKTYHIVHDELLKRMRPGTILLNTSRGEVVDNRSLKRALGSGHLSAAILDVWEGEPEIDMQLLHNVAIGTPHIAAYTEQGKLDATRMVYEAACRFLAKEASPEVLNKLKVTSDRVFTLSAGTDTLEEALSQAFRMVYDIRKDDALLRRIETVEPSKRREYFDDLRNRYTLRHECSSYRADLSTGKSNWREVFTALGFCAYG